MVDDDSVDNTEEVARKYCETDSRLIYINQENQGPSNARKNAIVRMPSNSDNLLNRYLNLN